MGTTAQKLQAILDSKADIASAIEEKGGVVPDKLSDYGDAIRNLPTGETEQPDVEFIDYNGRTLHRYTFEEALALEAMPELPSNKEFETDFIQATGHDSIANEDVTLIFDTNGDFLTDGVTGGISFKEIRNASATYTCLAPLYSHTAGNSTSIYGPISGWNNTVITATAEVYVKATKDEVAGTYDISMLSSDFSPQYSFTLSNQTILLENEGWNYNLSEVSAAAAEGKRTIVGCTYTTDDGVTRIFVTIPSGDPTLHIAFAQSDSKSVLLNWGDGVYNLANMTTSATRAHTYDHPGNYIVSLAPQKNYATLKLDGNIGGSGAVVNNVKITNVAFGKVLSIGGYIFNGCDNLKVVSIPKDTTIGSYCLDSMVDLEAFVVPNTVTDLPQNVFEYCTRLTKVSIPPSVSGVGNYAFYGCSSLTNIGLVNVTDIGENAFQRCTDLINVQAKDVKLIKTACFYGCGALKTLDVDSITGIMGNAFYGCGEIEEIGTTSAIISEFGSGSSNFAYCDDLTTIGELHIPAASSNNYKPTIGTDCFRECKSLRSIKVVPDDSTTTLQISANAFYKSGITTYDFSECTKVPEVGNVNAFSQSASDKVIKIPSANISDWTTAPVWQNFPIAANVSDYSTSVSYAVGDFCIHDGLYYRCKSATSGNWNASKWELVTGFLLPV